MNKEFIPYQLALELKQLGFDEYCIAYYNELEIRRTGEIIRSYTKRGQDLKEFREADSYPEYKRYLKEEHCISKIRGQDTIITLAPTYAQAFRFFREKYFLHVPIMIKEGVWYFDKFSTKGYQTYEEAERECLKKLIEIVKEKQI